VKRGIHWALKGLEVGEGRFDWLGGKPPSGQSTGNTYRLPSKIEVEIAKRCRYRRPGRVVENDEPSWPNELSKKVQIHEHFVKAMAAVDERGVGREPLVSQARQRDRRRVSDEGGLRLEAGGDQRLPSNVVVCGRLEGVDDDMRDLLPSRRRQECFTDRERRASVRQPDFDYDTRPVGDEHVTQYVAVRGGQRYALEVALEWPAPFRTGGMQLGAQCSYPLYSLVGFVPFRRSLRLFHRSFVTVRE